MNLGNALKELGDLDAAIASYNVALKLNPSYTEAHINLGNTLSEQGDLAAAIDSYYSALLLSPNHLTQNNLSMAELRSRNYKSGWERYEYRFQCRKNQEDILNANPSCRKWNGEEILKDSKLLLVSEQGLGDTLQFMRYATALRDRDFSFIVCSGQTSWPDQVLRY